MLFAVPLLAGVLVLGACKSSNNTTTSNNQGNSTTTTKASSNAGGSDDTAGPGTTKGTQPGQANLNGLKVWWHGFRYDLGEVSYDSETHQAQIKAKVTNLGKETASPIPTNALTKGGEQIATGGLKETPAITGGKTIDNSIVFSIEDFSPTGTTLLFTDGASFQEAKVPLDGKGELVTLEPVKQDQTVPPIVLGQVTFTPKTIEVRYDVPDEHSIEAAADSAILIITGTSKNDAETQLQYQYQGVTVTTGTGTYTSDFIGGDVMPAKQTTDTAFYFQIKQPVDGDWTLEFKDQPFGPDSEVVSSQFKGVLVVKASTTGTTR